MTADAVGASGGLTVHEVPECGVGSPGSPLEGPGELLQLAGGGVGSKGDQQLPHAVPYLALRSTHDPMDARGRYGFMGWAMGRDAEQQKGRCFRTGPDLHFLWWRGFRAIA
ncbi:MAG: hypothetical protein M0Z95_18490 [Actinomycetota bacterium]|nr:hypothetical protein [Actinomycetota bacterium]